MRIIFFIFSILCPICVFFLSLSITDWVFRKWMIVYPFEPFGIVVGLGLACWTHAVILLIKRKSKTPHPLSADETRSIDLSVEKNKQEKDSYEVLYKN